MPASTAQKIERKPKIRNLILPDTSLCAIVRDEVMNPAGGIVDFIESTMPFVEAGVIVDTGSIDGTRELLEEMQGKYKNLKIYDHKFDGYASSRNVSLSKLKTKRALVLDADERLTRGDFISLSKILSINEHKQNPYKAFNFRFIEIGPDKEDDLFINGHNPRLFENSTDLTFATKEKGKIAEFLYRTNGKWLDKAYSDSVYDPGITIKHFISSPDENIKKREDWYELLRNELALRGTLSRFDVAPSEIPSFKQWKQYNPRRELYR